SIRLLPCRVVRVIRPGQQLRPRNSRVNVPDPTGNPLAIDIPVTDAKEPPGLGMGTRPNVNRQIPADQQPSPETLTTKQRQPVLMLEVVLDACERLVTGCVKNRLDDGFLLRSLLGWYRAELGNQDTESRRHHQ